MNYTTMGRFRRGGKNIATRLHTGRVPQPLTTQKGLKEWTAAEALPTSNYCRLKNNLQSTF